MALYRIHSSHHSHCYRGLYTDRSLVPMDFTTVPVEGLFALGALTATVGYMARSWRTAVNGDVAAIPQDAANTSADLTGDAPEAPAVVPAGDSSADNDTNGVDNGGGS